MVMEEIRRLKEDIITKKFREHCYKVFDEKTNVLQEIIKENTHT